MIPVEMPSNRSTGGTPGRLLRLTGLILLLYAPAAGAERQCEIKNPVVLRGELNPFGTHGHTCSLEEGVLTMKVTDRDGDYAMCCIDLPATLDLSARSTACADVAAEQPDPTVDIKFEVRASPKHVFVAHKAEVRGREIKTHRLTPIEKKWRVNRVCMASVGDGPLPNTLWLHSIGFASR